MNDQPDDQPESKTSLQAKQEVLAHHVRMLARKLSHALFVYGLGGTGKTMTVLRVLQEEYGIDPLICNSHVTPLSLFGLLYEHRSEQVILFDDCDAMYSSMPCLGLLRSALWGSPRIVTYNSSQLPPGLPQSFEFESRCVFISNTLPKRNDAFQAVLSRCDQYDLSASNAELIDQFRSVSNNGFYEVSAEECEQVIDFIEQHSEERQLSMRLLGPSIRKYKYARMEGIDWRPLVLSQLSSLGKKTIPSKRLDNRIKDFRLIEQVMRKHPDSVAEQQAEWSRLAGKSRASFFRVMARFKERQNS